MTDSKIENIEVRNLNMNDYLELKDSMIEAYHTWAGAYWREHHIETLLNLFPEGQIAVTVGGKVVGAALSIIVKYNDFGDDHTYRQITGNFTFNTHNPKGDVLYGTEVFIHPDYRDMRLGRRLYDVRKELCESLVFTPSDFPFPTNGVKAEATPNTEAVLIVDVDIDLLKELHHFGTVRTLKDRRKDLYEVRFCQPTG